MPEHSQWDKEDAAPAAAKSLQSCPTLCNPIDGSPPGYPVPGILQARTLEWVAISFSNAGKWKVKVKSFGRVRLFTTPWSAVHQAPPSMGFSRQEYWSGVPLPSPTKRLEAHMSLNYTLSVFHPCYLSSLWDTMLFFPTTSQDLTLRQGLGSGFWTPPLSHSQFLLPPSSCTRAQSHFSPSSLWHHRP